MSNTTNKILNNSIKIIYRKNNGKTIKNAIMTKQKCNQYITTQLQTQKNKNKTKNNNRTNRTINQNDKYNENIKCFIKRKIVKREPKIIIKNSNNSHSTDLDNKKYSYLIIMISNIMTSYNETKDEEKKHKKYINWIAVINDNKIDKNIIKYSLDKTKGVFNFIIRIYKFPKNDITIINNIEKIVNLKLNKIIKKLKTIEKLERIYTNNIIITNDKRSNRFLHRWLFGNPDPGSITGSYSGIGTLFSGLSSLFR